jgi:hypothetical protein
MLSDSSFALFKAESVAVNPPAVDVIVLAIRLKQFEQ